MASQIPFGSPQKKIKTYHHRRQNMSVGQVANYTFHFLDNQLYYLGAQLERGHRNGRRDARKGAKIFFSALGRFFSVVFAAIWRVIAAAFVDLTAPLFKGIKALYTAGRIKRKMRGAAKAEKKAAVKEYFRDGWARNRYVVSRFINIVFPATALAGMAIVMYTMLTLNYGLQINIGNTIIGYAASEEDFNDAKQIIVNKIAQTDNVGYWMSDAVYYISVVPEDRISTQNELADSLLRASGSEISSGTGLYVGGVFIGAIVDGEQLSGLLDNILQEERDTVAHIANAEVSFVRDVELVEGIYMTSSLYDADYFSDLIADSRDSVLQYTVKGGDAAQGIAAKNALTLEQLETLNPDVDFSALSEGTVLTLSEGDDLFETVALVKRTYTQEIAYSVVSIPDTNQYVGYLRILTEGSKGEKLVTENIEYKNGKIVARTYTEEVVVEAINQRVVVGVKSTSGSGSRVGTGDLIWPTQTYYFISRGLIPGVHYGIDIAAGMGVPVLASDTGVVQNSAVYSDYGEFILINHNNGMQTAYAHLSARFVSYGDVVTKGQVIGLVGSTGRSTGPHLHFEVRINGERVDPKPWIDGTY